MEPGVRALIGVSTHTRRKPKTSSDVSMFVNLGVGKSGDECLLKAKGLRTKVWREEPPWAEARLQLAAARGSYPHSTDERPEAR